MAALGSFLLLAAFVVCSYSGVASVVGARRGSRRLVESGIGAFYLITAFMTCASAVMINAFLTNDYSITSFTGQRPAAFCKITSYWAGRRLHQLQFPLSIFGALRCM